ncbi:MULTISPECIES: hypothetical protein [unclassified Beijerinckia]|uniref:hypothetical protein n=1 Tax=unclassified Beijerinckia TaxID=2638183 RepID=UPI000899B3FF|nr:MULTISPECIES: hypothetical protein [unclassified Beijerinckia]MDH7796391.1 hypothetical protein [Beijerinckia sp. GAS462]SEC43144.1 hypothetical protein SAMN05443249_2674 [Beijerinckia sp. 28-YEA-48]
MKLLQVIEGHLGTQAQPQTCIIYTMKGRNVPFDETDIEHFKWLLDLSLYTIQAHLNQGGPVLYPAFQSPLPDNLLEHLHRCLSSSGLHYGPASLAEFERLKASEPQPETSCGYSLLPGS